MIAVAVGFGEDATAVNKSCMEESPVGTPGGAHKSGPIGVHTSMSEY